MHLYEIDRALLDVIETGYSVDEETGEILFEPEDLERLELDRKAKVEGCALYLKGLQAEAEAIKVERDKLDTRLKAKQRKIERMQSYILASLRNFEQERLETPRVVLSTRKSIFVDVYDLAKLPLDYIVRKVTESPDKKAIRQAIKGGEIVPGAELVERVSLAVK